MSRKKISNSHVCLPGLSGGPSITIVMGTGAVKQVHKRARESVQAPIETFGDMGKDKNWSVNKIIKIAKIF